MPSPSEEREGGGIEVGRACTQPGHKPWALALAEGHVARYDHGGELAA